MFSSILFLFALLANSVFTQTLTNLEQINLLVDSSALKIVLKIQDTSKVYNIENNTPSEYSILDSRIVSGLNKFGIKILESSINKITYTISKAGVEYTDLFRNGLFGEYLLEGKFNLNGNYVVNNPDTNVESDTFELTLTDTISYDDLVLVENSSLPFTKDIPPSEPFLPSILEPVIAITAVAVTVILFFSVRSK